MDARLEWLVELPRYAVPGPLPRAVIGCVLVVLGLVVGGRRARRGEASPGELAVLAATLFLACGLVGPIDIPGWQLVAPRFVSLGMPLAVALLAPLRAARSERAWLAGIVVLTGLSLALSDHFHRRLARGCEPALAGLSSNVDSSRVSRSRCLSTRTAESPRTRR